MWLPQTSFYSSISYVIKEPKFRVVKSSSTKECSSVPCFLSLSIPPQIANDFQNLINLNLTSLETVHFPLPISRIDWVSPGIQQSQFFFYSCISFQCILQQVRPYGNANLNRPRICRFFSCIKGKSDLVP